MPENPNLTPKKDEDFSSPPDENKQTRPPGAFTKAFLDLTGNSGSSTPAVPESSGSATNILSFKGQVGNANIFAPIPGSGDAAEPQADKIDVPKTSQFSGAFTRMFSPASSPAAEDAVDPAREKPRGVFTEAFGQSGSKPKSNISDVDRTPSAEFFKNVPVADSGPAQPPAGKQREQGPSNFFGFQESSETRIRSPKPEERSASDDFFRPVDRESRQENPLATRVLNSADLKAVPLSSGQSEYTKFWNRSQLRDLQTQQGAPASGAAAPSVQPVPQALPAPPNFPVPGTPPTVPWPVAAPQAPPYPQMPAPQTPSPQMPAPQMPVSQVAWPPANPTTPPMPKGEAVLRGNESPLMKYLPLIIGLNALFLIALLLIVLFALKR